MYGKGKVKVLPGLTLEKINIDIDKLNPRSHKKIYVQCSRCEEIFLRERRKLHLLHGCPLHIQREDGTWLKWCNGCKLFLIYLMFNKNESRYDKLNSWCKTCCTNSWCKKKLDAEGLTLNEWMKRFLSTKKSKCKKDGIPCTISLDDLQSQWAEQVGRCYYTKVKLIFGVDNLWSAYLDRIIPKRGYVKNNIVWASKTIYNMKNHYVENELASFIESMIFPSVRFECVIEHPQAKLPFRKRTTDAGHDVYSVTEIIIQPSSVVNIETGLRVSPPPGFYLTVDGRSSLFKEGVVPFRGIIDATYTGPLLISLYNSSNKQFEVNIGDRVAQLTIHKIHHADFVEVKEFSPIYKFRGNEGWGSSGRNG